MEVFYTDVCEKGCSLLHELWTLDKGLLGAQPGECVETRDDKNFDI